MLPNYRHIEVKWIQHLAHALHRQKVNKRWRWWGPCETGGRQGLGHSCPLHGAFFGGVRRLRLTLQALCSEWEKEGPKHDCHVTSRHRGKLGHQQLRRNGVAPLTFTFLGTKTGEERLWDCSRSRNWKENEWALDSTELGLNSGFTT